MTTQPEREIEAKGTLWFDPEPETPLYDLVDEPPALRHVLRPGRDAAGRRTTVLLAAWLLGRAEIAAYGSAFLQALWVVAVDLASGNVRALSPANPKWGGRTGPSTRPPDPEGPWALAGSACVDVVALLGLPRVRRRYAAFLWADHLVSEVSTFETEGPDELAPEPAPGEAERFPTFIPHDLGPSPEPERAPPAEAPPVVDDPEGPYRFAWPAGAEGPLGVSLAGSGAPRRCASLAGLELEGAVVVEPDLVFPPPLVLLARGYRRRGFGSRSLSLPPRVREAGGARFSFPPGLLLPEVAAPETVFALALQGARRSALLRVEVGEGR